ncbi:UDP-N-acetylmuramate--L-alanine ligase [Tumebacillus permanentifrigoris]|uniref:UDP-N-acetylmuramate--L-alanine ligase n=1 Tax=Tumebacillus permanentifrigoris TaxID=378543 RepID=A0A316DGE3_9BACL|nr:UDP-N-acetylmuramate--L-alanine ligase [Tumebacillus permanentifrigoris]PWK15643.1 UDP-N-acetylmuramate--L-alanine ligase [Tumebacillus permanentifrigoris]
MRKIHFVGIKGAGTSALAQLYARMGYEVTGSDSQEVFFTDELLSQAGITYISSPSAVNVEGVDLVCHSPAYNEHHVEIARAHELGIPVYNYPQMLGKLTQERPSILITGTHGKTTTTSMVGAMLTATEQDPMVVIGSKNYNIGSNARYGAGMLVAEACEYKRHFLYYQPQVLVVNNIDFDHPDYFRDLDDVFLSFQQLVDKLPEDGVLVACGDDPLCRKLETEAQVLYFGLDPSNDIYATNIHEERGVLRFDVWEGSRPLGTLQFRSLGQHNVLNALATIAVSRYLKQNFEDVQVSLSQFQGVYRRFDYLGRLGGMEVYDDYAHHPSEISTTLRAVKASFPNDPLITVFQPHTYSRTQKFLTEFVDSLTLSDEVLLVKLFSSAREQDPGDALTEQLADAIRQRGKLVTYVENLEEGTRFLRHYASNNQGIVLTMGAGNVRGIGEDSLSFLLESKSE